MFLRHSFRKVCWDELNKLPTEMRLNLLLVCKMLAIRIGKVISRDSTRPSILILKTTIRWTKKFLNYRTGAIFLMYKEINKLACRHLQDYYFLNLASGYKPISRTSFVKAVWILVFIYIKIENQTMVKKSLF